MVQKRSCGNGYHACPVPAAIRFSGSGSKTQASSRHRQADALTLTREVTRASCWKVMKPRPHTERKPRSYASWSTLMIVYLIGPRAAGKTTLGSALANRLGWEFVDTDVHLQHTRGKSIEQIVQEEGWPGFRAHESAALREVTPNDAACGRVIATGGGIILSPENRTFMRAKGTVLLLTAPVPILVERLKNDSHKRPSLTGTRSSEEEMADILAQRMPLYEETAHHSIDALLPVARLCENVLCIIQKDA